MTTSGIVGGEVEAWMKRLDLTLDDVGRVLGADRMTVWRWVKRRSEPAHPEMLVRAMRDYEREVSGGRR